MIFLNAGSNIASLLQKKVRIWNIFTGRDVMNFDLTLRNKEKVVMLRASSNGRYFAFGTLNNTKRSNYTGTVTGDLGVRLWDAIEKKFVREWPLPKYLEWMEFSPDNQWLAFAGENSRVHLARVGFADQDFELHLGENTKKVTQITFSPDGRQLACAAIVPIRDQDASRIFIYELASKKIRLKLVDDPTGIIERLAYSGDSGLLASGGTDTTALVWNTGLRTFAAKPAGKVATLGELADWYHEMAGANAETAYQNMIKLAQTPKQAIRFFADKIPPTTKPGTDENTMLHARAVEVLEAIATPEAHALLTRWSAGDPTAVLTRESRKALAALKQ